MKVGTTPRPLSCAQTPRTLSARRVLCTQIHIAAAASTGRSFHPGTLYSASETSSDSKTTSLDNNADYIDPPPGLPELANSTYGIPPPVSPHPLPHHPPTNPHTRTSPPPLSPPTSPPSSTTPLPPSTPPSTPSSCSTPRSRPSHRPPVSKASSPYPSATSLPRTPPGWPTTPPTYYPAAAASGVARRSLSSTPRSWRGRARSTVSARRRIRVSRLLVRRWAGFGSEVGCWEGWRYSGWECFGCFEGTYLAVGALRAVGRGVFRVWIIAMGTGSRLRGRRFSPPALRLDSACQTQ